MLSVWGFNFMFLGFSLAALSVEASLFLGFGFVSIDAVLAASTFWRGRQLGRTHPEI